jgi:predicted MFS family arabinose efflux permease
LNTTATITPPEPPPVSLGGWLTFAMAAAAGVAIANVYYCQPMLGMIERDLPGTAAGMIPTATQLGYAAGLLLLVPLGDLVERRRLIVLQFLMLTVTLAACAVAPSAGLVVAASLLLGVSATVAQQIVPFAVHLAAPERRGAAVGSVMSGMLTGILLSRTLAGFVATHAGWREMFGLSVPMTLAAGVLMGLGLPRSQPQTRIGYVALMRSLLHLWREFPGLRLAAITQALLFAAFTVFWTILALHLEEARLSLGADVAGLFGIVGAIGILVAPVAGRIADSSGPHRVIALGTGLTLVSWLLFSLWTSVFGLVVGVIVLDFGIQGALVSNQHLVYALRPEARSRLNTLFVGAMYLGGSFGSAAAALAWKTGGWTFVSVLGVALAAAAAILQAASRRRSP